MRRQIRLISILSFIHSTVWRTLFGKAADSLEKVRGRGRAAGGRRRRARPRGADDAHLPLCFDARQGTDAEDEYMISDANLLVNKYVSVPRDMGHLNCGAYVAGIVKVRSAPVPAAIREMCAPGGPAHASLVRARLRRVSSTAAASRRA